VRKNNILKISSIVLIILIGVLVFLFNQDDQEHDLIEEKIEDTILKESQSSSVEDQPEEIVVSNIEGVDEAEDIEDKDESEVVQKTNEALELKPLESSNLPIAIEGFVTDANGDAVSGAEVKLGQKHFFAPTGHPGLATNTGIVETENLGETTTGNDGYYLLPIDRIEPFALEVFVEDHLVYNERYFSSSLVVSRKDQDFQYIKLDLEVSSFLEHTVRIVYSDGELYSNESVELYYQGNQVFDVFGQEKIQTDENGFLKIPFNESIKKAKLALEDRYDSRHLFEVSNPPDVEKITIPIAHGVVQGTVFFENTEEPVSHAYLEVLTTDRNSLEEAKAISFQTMADENGNFEFKNLVSSEWDIIAARHADKAKRHEQFHKKRLFLGENEKKEGVEIFLPTGSPSWKIRVIDKETKEPIEGAEFSESAFMKIPDFLLSLRTGPDGYFDLSELTMSDLQFENYLMYAYVSAKANLTRQIADFSQLDNLRSGEKEITVEMSYEDFVQINGIVSNEDGAPLPGVSVSVSHEVYMDTSRTTLQDVTDEFGRYVVEAVYGFDTQLRFRQPDYQTSYSKIFQTTEEQMIYDHQMDKGGGLRIKVLDLYGSPVENAKVNIHASYRTDSSMRPFSTENGVTNIFGVYETELYPDSDSVMPISLKRFELAVHISHDEYESINDTSQTISSGEVKEVTYNFENVDRSGFIEAYVYDQNKNPLEGAKVYVLNNDVDYWETFRTDPLGFVMIEELIPGDYEIWATHEQGSVSQKTYKVPIHGLELIIDEQFEYRY